MLHVGTDQGKLVLTSANMAGQGSSHAFGRTRNCAGQREDAVDQIVDLPAKLARVDLVSKGLELFLLFLADGVRRAEAVKGGARLVVAAFHSRGFPIFLGPSLLRQAHDRLEEVVVHPHHIVETIDGYGLSDTVEPVVPEVGTHQR